MNTMEWIINWFETNTHVKREGIEANVGSNYFEAGFIDSIGLIAFISAIEAAWHIEFRNEDFQDRRFSTIIGLSEIIDEKDRESNG
jgi:acyl carrier protein